MNNRHIVRTILYFFLLSIAQLTTLTSCDSPKSKDEAQSGKRAAPKEAKRLFLPGREACSAIAGYILNGKTGSSPYDEWHLRLSAVGTMRWNGTEVHSDILRGYLLELSKTKPEAGYLSVEIEPRTPCALVDGLRTVVKESGLCSNGRCTENNWNIKLPKRYEGEELYR